MSKTSRAAAVLGVILGYGIVTCACAYPADLPDPHWTPGAARHVSTREVCRRGSSRDARHVTEAMRRQVFRRYGMPRGNHTGACRGAQGCEIDHLISLELGGANAITNLWPQPFAGRWNARMKDRLELRLHQEVCTGVLPMRAAQHAIRTDWVAAFRKRFPEPMPR